METTSEGLPRTYVIKRSEQLGYGFMAGYELPTMVKIVQPNGPSFNRLLPGDVIMAVNGIDVENASREKIIKMIQLCGDQIEIKVRQPSYEELIRAKNLAEPDMNSRTFAKNQMNYGRHSPLPQRCKSSIDATHNENQNRNEQPLLKRSNTMRPIKSHAKVIEILKVLEVRTRVFFEDGHTKCLNYDSTTTVADILEILNSTMTKMTCIAPERYFGLALTVDKRKKLHILDENDSISKISQLPYSRELRLLYRMVRLPSDVSSLYVHNRVAFEYLYRQSCNDLKYERFSPPLEQETSLKLCALHLLEYVHSNHSKELANSKDPKVFIKLTKKSVGIPHFLPSSLEETIQGREGKKMLSNYKKLIAEHLRKNFEEFDFEPPKVKSTTNLNKYSSTSFHELTLPKIQSKPSDYIKLQFLTYLSQLSCYNSCAEPPIYESKEVDMVQTPSIESVSSITFNMNQNTPSPQQTHPQSDLYPSMTNTTASTSEPSPMPRQQRHVFNQRSIDDLLKKFILPPPPTPLIYNNHNNRFYLTRVLSDKDLEKLRVPPPPRMIN